MICLLSLAQDLSEAADSRPINQFDQKWIIGDCWWNWSTSFSSFKYVNIQWKNLESSIGSFMIEACGFKLYNYYYYRRLCNKFHPFVNQQKIFSEIKNFQNV